MKRILPPGLSLTLMSALAVQGCSPLSFLATPTPTHTPLPRSAQVSELVNQVDARRQANVEWRPATEGEQIVVGGGVRTGDAARARVDISDGAILRLASTTEFELTALTPESVDAMTRWILRAGKLWVQVTQALGQGVFEIETPTGAATVRGSLMSVEYFPDNGHMIVSCLDGACRLTGQSGVFTDLAAGQQAEISGFGQDPTPPQPIDSAQAADWLNEFPEAQNLAATLTPGPPPTDTPTPRPTPTATPTFTPTPSATPTPTATPIAAIGAWSGTTSQGWTIEFEVTADWRIANLEITFPRGAIPCRPSGGASSSFLTSIRTAENTTLAITDNRFSLVTWGLEGEFTSPQQASGAINYSREDCTISEPSGTWEAAGP